MKLPLKSYWTLLHTYLRPQWPRMVVLATLLALKIALQLVNPQLIRTFLDQALGGAPVDVLLWRGAAFFLIAAITQGLTVANLYVSQNVAWTATNALRVDLLRHCLGLDMHFHKAHTPAELTERIDGDVDTLSNFFSQFVLHVLGNSVLALGVLVMLAREQWSLGVLFTIFAGGGLIVLVRMRNWVIPHWNRLHEERARFYGFLGEHLTGTEDIRANGAGDYVLHRFYAALRHWLPIHLNAALAAHSGWMTNAALVAVGECLAVGAAGYLFYRGLITLGVAYLVDRYMGLLFGQIAELRWQISDLQHADAAIARVNALLALRSSLIEGDAGPLPPGPLAVTFDHVSFAYEHGSGGNGAGNDAPLVLHQLNFTLAAGQVLGLLGRTGSGKTTVARLLLRLYDPTAGQVCLGGTPLTATTLSEIRRRVALVTQEVHLFHATVRDNLTLFNPHIDDAEIHRVLHTLGLGPWLGALPDGLDTELNAEGGGLSAGEAQLLAFARVFLRDPDVVILDEASSRLDPATEQRLERAVDLLLANRTAILIAHRLNTVQRADQIVILEEGRIREMGPRVALAHDPNTYFHHLLQTGMEEVLA